MSTRPDRYGRTLGNDAYEAARRVWYKKLEDTGFEDIEEWKNERVNSYLRGHHIRAGQSLKGGVLSGKAEAFRLLESAMDDIRWKSRRMRIAVMLYGWGFKPNDIVERVHGYTITPGALGKVIQQHFGKALLVERARETEDQLG